MSAGGRSAAELEARVRANLDDWAAWRVYGDWLLEQGDVRGELIQLGYRLETEALSAKKRKAVQARISELEAEHRAAWRAGLEAPAYAELDWRFGFVVTAKLRRWGAQTPGALERLVAHPSARFLVTLDLVSGIRSEAASALAGSEVLRALVVSGPSDRPRRIRSPGLRCACCDRILQGRYYVLRCDQGHEVFVHLSHVSTYVSRCSGESTSPHTPARCPSGDGCTLIGCTRGESPDDPYSARRLRTFLTTGAQKKAVSRIVGMLQQNKWVELHIVFWAHSSSWDVQKKDEALVRETCREMIDALDAPPQFRETVRRKVFDELRFIP